MTQIARLKDPQISNGNTINADDLDDEFNQLVNECNAQDTRLTDIESNTLIIGGVKTFSSQAIFSSGFKTDSIAVVSSNGATSMTLAGAGVNAQTGTTYTVVTGDRNKLITFSNASAVAVTLPQAGSTGFANSFEFEVKNIGDGLVTITPTTSTVDGAATITLATGQSVRLYSDGTNYFSTPGKTATSTLEYLGTSGVISSAASVSFTTAAWFSSTYSKLIFECIDIAPANDGVNWLLTASVDAGVNYLAGTSYDYAFGGGRDSAATAVAGNSTGTTSHSLNGSVTIGSNTNEVYNGTIIIKNLSGTTNFKDTDISCTFRNTATALQTNKGGGSIKTTSAVNAVKFAMSGGNIASGLILVYGVRAS